MVGTMDTIMLSWLITGNINHALKIGGFEVITKTILYFIHERAWLRIGKKGRDSHFKSFGKAVSWRMVGTMDTIIISFIIIHFFGSDEHLKIPAIFQASTIGLAELFTKILLFYLHERVWSGVAWGKELEK